MTFAIQANITRAHKESLGFEYETRLVRGRFSWAKGSIASFTDSKNPEPKLFKCEDSVNSFIKGLRKVSKTDKHITVIDFSIVKR